MRRSYYDFSDTFGVDRRFSVALHTVLRLFYSDVLIGRMHADLLVVLFPIRLK